ncbi:MAG: DUF4406 domain-containing protein [Candidatus Azobacteroides sp.]|nr:DUF4406 domain-containing protein [Candidatus Azobacteroides sp.]
MKERIYISGAVSGLAVEEVTAKFNEAEKYLTRRGFRVVSPLKTGIPYSIPCEIHIAINILLLIGCDAVYLLHDWKYSKGATLEKNIAEFTGKKIIYQEAPVFAELKHAIFKVMMVSFYEISSRNRSRDNVYARMIYAYFCMEKGISNTDISKEIKHDCSTINYYIKKYKEDYKYNPKFREIANQIKKTLSKTDF